MLAFLSPLYGEIHPDWVFYIVELQQSCDRVAHVHISTECAFPFVPGDLLPHSHLAQLISEDSLMV